MPARAETASAAEGWERDHEDRASVAPFVEKLALVPAHTILL